MTEMNILDLFLKASLLVKLIMLILVCFSIASWAIIIQRTRILNSASREAEAFEDKFWSGIELSRLYQESQGRRASCEQPCAGSNCRRGIARHAYFDEPRAGNPGDAYSVPRHGRFYQPVYRPVWYRVGDHARLYRAGRGEAGDVADGCTGLFAAIPAVMAYNRLNQRVNKLELNYDNFMEEFTAILHRQAFTSSESNKG